MNDRAWLLNNVSAISCAKTCIKTIQREFGVKLTLSDPKLLAKMEKINDHLNSPVLDAAYKELLGYAGRAAHSHHEMLHALGSSLHDAGQSLLGKIEHHGKEYPRFDDDGKEFKGVYRGHARYA